MEEKIRFSFKKLLLNILDKQKFNTFTFLTDFGLVFAELQPDFIENIEKIIDKQLTEKYEEDILKKVYLEEDIIFLKNVTIRSYANLNSKINMDQLFIDIRTIKGFNLGIKDYIIEQS